MKAAKTDWKAAAEFMARFHPYTPEVDEDEARERAARFRAEWNEMGDSVPSKPDAP